MSSLSFVAHRNPCLDPADGPDDVLGELTEATDKWIRIAYNAPGEGGFRINANSSQAAWCTQGNYVRAYRDTPAGDLLFGFFVETGSDVTVSTDEEAGEVLTRTGRGALSILDRVILYNESFLANGDDLGALPQDDPDGMWHWTDRPPGAILVRQLEEAQARGVPSAVNNSAIPPVTWDFTRLLDSNTDAWTTSAGDLFKLPVGMGLLEYVGVAQDIGLIVSMSANFELKAWDTAQGSDLSATIIFAKGVNIIEAGDREIALSTAASHVLVQGDKDPEAGGFIYRERDDGPSETAHGRIERFKEYRFTPTGAKLNKAGDTALERANRRYVGVDTIKVLERADEFPMLHYFPGDSVGLTIGPLIDDVYRIGSILLADRDNGEYDPVIQFEGGEPIRSTTVEPMRQCCGASCKRRETFDLDITGDTLTLLEAYVAGSVRVRMRESGNPSVWLLLLGPGGFDETSPTTGVVDIVEAHGPDTFVDVFYISASCDAASGGYS